MNSKEYAYGLCKITKTVKREKDSHKGTFGTVLSICGSYGFCGASVLSAKAALRSGAGLIKAFICDKNYTAFCSVLSEAVVIPCKTGESGEPVIEENLLIRELGNCSSVVFGCGTGKSDNIKNSLKTVLENSSSPIILDADGINLLSMDINIIREIKAPLIITPHPKEMSRLTNLSVEEIQNDRIGTARRFAEDYNCTVVLKGCNTVVALPGGEVFLNKTGNPGMATGGSGDVLAGIIASLSAQGYSEKDAAVTGVYVHSFAADIAAEKYTERSLLPSDIIEELKNISY